MSEQSISRDEIQSKILIKALENSEFRQQLLSNPTAAKEAVEQEIGQKLPDAFNVKVLQETEDTVYLVMPCIPDASGELSDAELEAVAGGSRKKNCVTGATIRVDCAFGSVCVLTNKGL